MKLLHLLESHDNAFFNHNRVLSSESLQTVNFEIKYIMTEFDHGLLYTSLHKISNYPTNESNIRYKMSIMFRMLPSDDMNYQVHNMTHNTLDDMALFAEKPSKLEIMVGKIITNLVKLKVKDLDELDRFLSNLDADDDQLVDLGSHRYYVR